MLELLQPVLLLLRLKGEVVHGLAELPLRLHEDSSGRSHSGYCEGTKMTDVQGPSADTPDKTHVNHGTRSPQSVYSRLLDSLWRVPVLLAHSHSAVAHLPPSAHLEKAQYQHPTLFSESPGSLALTD